MFSNPLLAEADGAGETLEHAFSLRLCRSTCRPAFDDVERQKPEQCHAREFQIEPQILCNLLDGPNPVELRRKLRFGHCETEPLYAVETIPGIGWNCGRIVIGLAAEILKLNQPQGGKGPLIRIRLSRDIRRVAGK